MKILLKILWNSFNRSKTSITKKKSLRMISILLLIPIILSTCALPFDGVSCPEVRQTDIIPQEEYALGAQLILLGFVPFPSYYSIPILQYLHEDLNNVIVRLVYSNSDDSFALEVLVAGKFPVKDTKTFITQDRVTKQVTVSTSIPINGTCLKPDCVSVRIWTNKELLIIYSCEETEPSEGGHDEVLVLFYMPINPWDIERIQQVASNVIPKHLMGSIHWSETDDLEGNGVNEVEEFERKRLRNVKIFGVIYLFIGMCMMVHWVYLYKEK